jgi:molybdopterin molybdotransferase
MLDFEPARERVLQLVKQLATESIPVSDADGRVLAEDLVSTVDLPPFDYSAMDGYAVLTRDFAGTAPWRLPMRGESRAGSGQGTLAAGTVMRILTGAPVPAGADAVVMQENVIVEAGRAQLGERPAPGAHIRRRGEDLARGAIALPRGTRLNPYRVGLVAALDRANVQVVKQPRVALLCTGDELRDPGSADRPGSIPDSNGPSLAALARRAGAVVTRLPRIADRLEETRAAIRSALAEHDVLLTVGGVSVGDHDVVKEALEAEGVRLDFWKVRIKPGKPLAFGQSAGALVLGLPGNPVSAQLALSLFGLPLLRALQGDAAPLPVPIRVHVASALAQKPGRLGFYRARLEGNIAHVHQNQASGAPTSMAQADALVMVPADSHGLAAGEEALALRLSDL